MYLTFFICLGVYKDDRVFLQYKDDRFLIKVYKETFFILHVGFGRIVRHNFNIILKPINSGHPPYTYTKLSGHGHKGCIGREKKLTSY